MPIPSPLDGLCLLLVEDEPLLALGMADAAASLGADIVGPVASVDDARALVTQLPELDAAILDVNLGPETVYPVADLLRERRVPFVFSTAVDGAELPERFHDVPLCRKPFDAFAFRAALEGLRQVA